MDPENTIVALGITFLIGFAFRLHMKRQRRKLEEARHVRLRRSS